MGASIDNEGTSPYAFSHAAGYVACPRTELVNEARLRPVPVAEQKPAG